VNELGDGYRFWRVLEDGERIIDERATVAHRHLSSTTAAPPARYPKGLFRAAVTVTTDSHCITRRQYDR
jgi:hypothetical protein